MIDDRKKVIVLVDILFYPQSICHCTLDFRLADDVAGGFTFVSCPQELIPNPVEHPRSVSECEFIMMCGLPACGKTYWIERHIEKYPKKSYVLLGTNAVIDQMKVMGLKRQANYANRWEELMSTATEVFNSLVAYAGSGVVPRNVIIDQTNVFKRARARKVQPFLGQPQLHRQCRPNEPRGVHISVG